MRLSRLVLTPWRKSRPMATSTSGRRRHPGPPQVFEKTVAGHQITEVMAAAISLPARAAFVFPGINLSGNLVFQETLQQPLESLFNRSCDEFPDFLLDIYLGLFYSFLWSRCGRLHRGVPPFYVSFTERVHPLFIFSNLVYITKGGLL